MAGIKVTRIKPLPYHDGECGMEHTGNPYCTPCHEEQARLREAFWDSMPVKNPRSASGPCPPMGDA